LGCRKKRMPSCNGADTGFNVTRHESEPTSDGCLFARAYGEHLKRGKPRELEVVRPPGGAPPPLASPELVPTMIVSQRLLGRTGQPGSIKGSAFEVLEPYAGRSSRQGCDPAGESPAVSNAQSGHVAMPHPGVGNQPGDAWCKRPSGSAPVVLRSVQSGGLASVGA
jgi:hypothetical protein